MSQARLTGPGQPETPIGRPALKGPNPDHLALNVAVTAFGGTFTAPLMHEVREVGVGLGCALWEGILEELDRLAQLVGARPIDEKPRLPEREQQNAPLVGGSFR